MITYRDKYEFQSKTTQPFPPQYTHTLKTKEQRGAAREPLKASRSQESVTSRLGDLWTLGSRKPSLCYVCKLKHSVSGAGLQEGQKIREGHCEFKGILHGHLKPSPSAMFEVISIKFWQFCTIDAHEPISLTQTFIGA